MVGLEPTTYSLQTRFRPLATDRQGSRARINSGFFSANIRRESPTFAPIGISLAALVFDAIHSGVRKRSQMTKPAIRWRSLARRITLDSGGSTNERGEGSGASKRCCAKLAG